MCVLLPVSRDFPSECSPNEKKNGFVRRGRSFSSRIIRFERVSRRLSEVLEWHYFFLCVVDSITALDENAQVYAFV